MPPQLYLWLSKASCDSRSIPADLKGVEMDQPVDQIFDEKFEQAWDAFDRDFRAALLAKFQELGSIHRLTGPSEVINDDYGRRFYEALEETLASGRYLEQWRQDLLISLPESLDEFGPLFRRHAVYPLHTFYLLLLFVHEYPLRAFFSGRDVPLPFNTLTLKFDQRLSDPTPTAVDYEIDMMLLDRCPGLSFASDALAQDATALINQGAGRHPQHHWKDLIWVWHFVTEPPVLLGQQ